jgi:hypothetical protein
MTPEIIAQMTGSSESNRRLTGPIVSGALANELAASEMIHRSKPKLKHDDLPGVSD